MTTERHVTPTMSLVQAESIINEAREAAVVSYAMPAHETEKFTKARELVSKALDAWGTGVRAEVVQRILRLAGQHPDGSKIVLVPGSTEGLPPDPYDEGKQGEVPPVQVTVGPPADATGAEAVTSAPPQNGSEPASDPDQDDFGISAGHVTPARRAAIARLKREGFAPPEMPKDETPPPLPRDLTTLSDGDLRKASGVWNAYFTYANWCLVQEEADLHVCEFMEAIEFDRAFAAVPKLDPDTNKTKLVDIIRAEANADQTVAKWRRRELQHKTMVSFYKNLKDNYHSNVERVSREMTARHHQWERTR